MSIGTIIRVVILVVVLLFLLTILGFISGLQPLTDSFHQWAYGAPVAHPHGDITQRVNDWLSFLPEDPMERTLIVCGVIVGLLVLNFLAGFAALSFQRRKQSSQLAEESRLKALQVYNNSQE